MGVGACGKATSKIVVVASRQGIDSEVQILTQVPESPSLLTSDDARSTTWKCGLLLDIPPDPARAFLLLFDARIKILRHTRELDMCRRCDPSEGSRTDSRRIAHRCDAFV